MGHPIVCGWFKKDKRVLGVARTLLRVEQLVGWWLASGIEAEGDREHDAPAGHWTDVVTPAAGGRARGGELIGVCCAVCRYVLRKERSCGGEAGDVVRVEEVVEAQPELCLVEATAAANGVVEEGAGAGKGIDRRLVVIGAVVDPLNTDALVEESEVPSLVLIGHALSLGVGGGLLYPQA